MQTVEYPIAELLQSHDSRIRALEVAYAKLFALAALGSAIGSFLAGKVW